MKRLALALVLCTAAFADKTLVYEIPNMACVSCYEVITKTINTLKAVKKFDVILEPKTADIVVQDDFAENTVVEVLKKQGYQAVLKSKK